MVTVVYDGRGAGRAESILLHSLSMSHLPGQHPLFTLELILVISGLGVIHVKSSCVGFIIFVFYLHSVSCSNIKIFIRFWQNSIFILGVCSQNQRSILRTWITHRCSLEHRIKELISLGRYLCFTTSIENFEISIQKWILTTSSIDIYKKISYSIDKLNQWSSLWPDRNKALSTLSSIS